MTTNTKHNLHTETSNQCSHMPPIHQRQEIQHNQYSSHNNRVKKDETQRGLIPFLRSSLLFSSLLFYFYLFFLSFLRSTSKCEFYYIFTRSIFFVYVDERSACVRACAYTAFKRSMNKRAAPKNEKDKKSRHACMKGTRGRGE